MTSVPLSTLRPIFKGITMHPGTCHCHCRYCTERFAGIEFFSNLQAIPNTTLDITDSHRTVQCVHKSGLLSLDSWNL
ncbi:uncharacterized protein Bfra_000193 [Botrytis fragariae]|uniref:Uncharacterized protein n=1 Tax=Botrytis fragariae TaxID=1964551 RepID=A0A8H6EMR0_9HELO|nr:uncharacterized protein Bfra_000193 [Botrytis fragariae]KAF5878026.1 hypothetical protein Bfra_000193 [Botrytis fragariae]